MGSVGEVVEVGMGSWAWTEFEVWTKREATGRLSGERERTGGHTVYAECSAECCSTGD